MALFYVVDNMVGRIYFCLVNELEIFDHVESSLLVFLKMGRGDMRSVSLATGISLEYGDDYQNLCQSYHIQRSIRQSIPRDPGFSPIFPEHLNPHRLHIANQNRHPHPHIASAIK